MAYPQAKRCLYNGIWFKSNLEGKVAESFDNLGIEWQYEPVVVRGPQFVGGQYTPDFYLPELNIYIEAAGVWDEKHESNAAEFCFNAGCCSWSAWVKKSAPRFLAVNGQGAMFGVTVSGKSEIEGLFLSKCTKCNRINIFSLDGPWDCRLCGAYDGDHYVQEIGRNLFDAAGVKRYGGR